MKHTHVFFARTLVGLHDDRIVSVKQDKSITLGEVAFIHGSPATGKHFFGHVAWMCLRGGLRTAYALTV